MVIPSRSAIGRSASTITRSRSSFSSVNGPSSERRQSDAETARSRETVPVSRPNPSGPYVTTPVPCSPHQRISSRSSSVEHGELLLERVHVADRLAPFDQVPVEVRDAEEPDRAGVLQLGHRPPRLLDRARRSSRANAAGRGRSRRCPGARAIPRTRRGPGRGGSPTPRTRGRASWRRGPGPGDRPPHVRPGPRRRPCRRPRRCRSSSCPRRARRAWRRSRPLRTRSRPTCRRRLPMPRSRSRSSRGPSIPAGSSACGPP